MNAPELERLLTPVVAAHNLEIDRVEVLRAGHRKVLRVFLDGDGPAGRGPSLDEIAEATRAISTTLDESTLTGDAPYTLEVSSRGVSRPLTEPKHYRRNRGRLVEVSGSDGPLIGRILSATEDVVVLDVGGTECAVDFAGINQAVVQVELNRSPDDEEEI